MQLEDGSHSNLSACCLCLLWQACGRNSVSGLLVWVFSSGVVWVLGLGLRFLEITSSGYPFLLKVSWRCNISFSFSVSSHTFSALLAGHPIVPDLTLGWWCEVKWVNMSIWVGFLYTVVLKVPSSFFTRTSRKLIWLFVSSSLVNWIWGCCSFRCVSKSSSCSALCG